MKPLRLSEIARMTGGRLHGDDAVVDVLVTDTRTLAQRCADAGTAGGALFVALKGENFDGHDHVATAEQAGVSAALVARQVDAGLAQVVVADTQRALADLATAVQRDRSTRVIAITGSNGKTSVKALLLAILEQAAQPAGSAVYATPGNRNNEIGLPLAVLAAPEDAQYAIYEMGTGKPGDIAYLTAIARPDIALVNNVAPAHLERMGSLLAIADTKAAVYDALPPDGVAVINADDAFAPYFAQRAHGRQLIRFGLEASAEVSARDIHVGAGGSDFMLVTPGGEIQAHIALPGRHNVCNALAAASLALGLRVPLTAIVAGLASAAPVAGRLVAHALGNGAALIDDSYNANPGSLDAAIDTLAAGRGQGQGQGEAWLVLGDMRELGDTGPALHAQAGRHAKAAGIARLYALGGLSAAAAQAFGEGARHFDRHAELAQALAADIDAHAGSGLRVLVKGSRGSAMEKIVIALLADGSNDGEGNTDAA